MASCVMLSSIAAPSFAAAASMSMAPAPPLQQGSTQYCLGTIRRFSGLKPAHKLAPSRVPCVISNYKSAAGAGTKAPLTIVCETTTLAKVQEIIAIQLSVDLSTVHPHTKFSDLGADSLDTVEIVMAIEEKFGVSISEESAEKISNVQQVADLIEKQKVAS